MKKQTDFYVILLALNLIGLSLIGGCKNTDTPLGHPGPFDVPTATFTATPTTVPGQVSVYCVVNYNATQVPGVNWTLVDPNGNTVSSATTNAANAVITTNTNVFGTYTVNLPAQGAFGLSTTTVNIPGPGTYPATFSCSNETITTNPSTWNYTSFVGASLPVTASYSATGNLNVPVSIVTSGLSSAFSISPVNSLVTNNSGSITFTLSKNSCSTSNITLNFNIHDSNNNTVGNTGSIAINRGYSIPVSVFAQVVATSPGVGNGLCGGVTIALLAFDGGLNCNADPYSYSYNLCPSCQYPTFSTAGYFGINNTFNFEVNTSSSDVQGVCSPIGSDYVQPSSTISFPDGYTADVTNALNSYIGSSPAINSSPYLIATHTY